MKKLFSSTNIRSLLAWLIKLGTMGFNLPATMGVIGSLVAGVTAKESLLKPITLVVLGTTISSDYLLLYVLILSGIVVLDTVFLASWYELDTNKTQDDSDKLADAITVVVMYALTILVGVLHGEGLAGFLFRVPMGVAVARSTWKTISYSMRRSGDDTKGKNMPLAVRWEQIKASSSRGVAIIRYELNNFLDDLKAQGEVIAAHRTARKEAGISIVVDMESIYKEQAVTSAKSNNISIVSSPSLTSKPALGVPNSSSTPTNTVSNSTSNQKYSIEPDGTEWVATCLHPGCSVVVRNGSKDSVRRKIVGHGNKHKNDRISIIQEAEVVEEVTTSEVVDSPDGF